MLSGSPAGVARKGTVTRFALSLFLDLVIRHQPSCLPLLHRFMLPGFIATMKALTSDLASPQTSGGPLGGAGSICTTRLVQVGSPCLSRLNFRPFRLQPPQCHFTTLALSRYISVAVVRVYPTGRPRGSREHRRADQGSNSTSSLPDRLGRIEFVILRTGLSPQVAPHLSSRKRSYHWLQAGNVGLIGTCTLQFKRLRRRTRLSLRESSATFAERL
jgi:hypothetical protein